MCDSDDRLETFRHLARRLMDDVGLRDWDFEYDRAKCRCGACHFSHRKITLSKYYVINAAVPEDAIRDTILHECAHALAGREAGHGDAWQRKAIEIGCKGNRVCEHGTVAPPAALLACPCTAANHFVNRVTARRRRLACVHCEQPLQVHRRGSSLYAAVYLKDP